LSAYTADQRDRRSVCRVPPSVVRPPKPTPIVIAGYVGYAIVGWFLNGLGSVLPELEDQIGKRASAYTLLPGVVLLVWGSIVVRRHRGAAPANPHTSTMLLGSVALAGGVLVMGITRWFGVSAFGAAIAAVAAAALIRLMPALLASVRPDDTERVMIRGNAYSSLAAIAAPLAVGVSIRLGGGWLPGMVVPIGGGAVVVVVLIARGNATGQDSEGPHPAEPIPDHEPVVPPFAAWWREITVLTLCIVVEFCFSYFAATFLHEEVGMSTAAAAAGGAAWGCGMAFGRFATSTWPPPRSILVSVALIAVGFVLLWGIATPVSSIAGIGLAGLGASPLYPTRMTALLQRFPRSPDQAATRGSIASGVALISAPALMGGLRAATDVRTAYLAVPLLLALLTVLARPTTAPILAPASIRT
jgi:MFS family permease